MKAKTFKCTAAQRKDAANIYYINCVAAAKLVESKGMTEIYNRYGKLLATFVTV